LCTKKSLLLDSKFGEYAIFKTLKFKSMKNNDMNILKWTIVVIAGITAVTIVAVTFLITNSANIVLAP
jgi:hypothetical protein